jgi:hypothetical protein
MTFSFKVFKLKFCMHFLIPNHGTVSTGTTQPFPPQHRISSFEHIFGGKMLRLNPRHKNWLQKFTIPLCLAQILWHDLTAGSTLL